MQTFVFLKNLILSPKKSSINSVRLEHARLDGANHKVNGLERKFLVWTGKYKTVEDVPAYVTQSTMERARNRMRIRIANYMMVATAIGCVIMVYSGKQAAKRGETVQKQNLEWHKKVNEGKEE